MCDDFIAELTRQLAPFALTAEILDVDANPLTSRRFGLKVPMLTADGSPVCHGRLDAAAVARLLSR